MKRKIVLTTLIASASAISFASFSSYRSILDVHLTVITPADVNAFGFSSFGGVGSGEADGSGTYSAVSNWQNGPVSAGIFGKPMVQGTASSDPGETSHADSQAQTTGHIRLANLTGSGGVTGQGRTLTIEMQAVFVFDLAARADATGDNAYAHAFGSIRQGGAIVRSRDRELSAQGPADLSHFETITVPFQVEIGPNSTTPIWMDVYADGYANSTTPVPEPGSVVGLLVPGLALWLRKKRRG